MKKLICLTFVILMSLPVFAGENICDNTDPVFVYRDRDCEGDIDRVFTVNWTQRTHTCDFILSVRSIRVGGFSGACLDMNVTPLCMSIVERLGL